MSKRAVITLGTVAGVALAALVIVAMLIADQANDQRDEAEMEWRTAVEDENGIVTDWDAYRDMWEDRVCHRDDMTGFFATLTERGTSVEVLRVSVSHACPDRMPELEEWAQTRPVVDEPDW